MINPLLQILRPYHISWHVEENVNFSLWSDYDDLDSIKTNNIVENCENNFIHDNNINNYHFVEDDDDSLGKTTIVSVVGNFGSSTTQTTAKLSNWCEMYKFPIMGKP